MMRCPPFRYLAPETAAEAARLVAAHGPGAALLAGGTDLLPRLKRGQAAPDLVVGLTRVAALRRARAGADGLELGAGVTLAATARHAALTPAHRALALAAGGAATPHVRNMGTLGGNLCADTRCGYYDQPRPWREAIGFCLKAPAGCAEPAAARAGEVAGTCWVAPGGRRCWAVASSDAAPALIALGAEVTVCSGEGSRRLAVAALHRDDGRAPLLLAPGEVLTTIHVPALGPAWRTTYWKLRRRGSFDFPVGAVALAVRLAASGEVLEARAALGGVASRPLVVETDALLGRRLDDEAVGAFAEAAVAPARPLDNTDYQPAWRRRALREAVAGALREVRGDPPEALGVLARAAARVLPRA